MIMTMDMCLAKVDDSYTPEVMCAGWNPEIAVMQGRTAALATQLIRHQSQRAGDMSPDMATLDAEAFLERMYVFQR
jgi:hypothetical protein